MQRIIDTIPLTIEHSLNQDLCSSLRVSLLQKLNFGGPGASERLGRLLEEDPAVVNERRTWKARQDKLEKVLSELRSFGV